MVFIIHRFKYLKKSEFTKTRKWHHLFRRRQYIKDVRNLDSMWGKWKFRLHQITQNQTTDIRMNKVCKEPHK